MLTLVMSCTGKSNHESIGLFVAGNPDRMEREEAMDDRPQTWHYGLVARWWAEFNRAEPDELAFYQEIIAGDGQPALDLACGTGRILLPLLRAGLDVDGCDLSPDMLALCREQATRAGLSPVLMQQAFHELAPPRVYRTIYICDSFGIGGHRAHDLEMLRRCYRHLAPGGVLVFSHELPYENADRWSSWLPEQRKQHPEPWPDAGWRQRAANGDVIELRGRLADLDPLAQRVTSEIRASLWRDGQRVSEEQLTIQISLYFCNEIRLMLATAKRPPRRRIRQWSSSRASQGESGDVHHRRSLTGGRSASPSCPLARRCRRRGSLCARRAGRRGSAGRPRG
jgi:SAM-dependent methyltransferase